MKSKMRKLKNMTQKQKITAAVAVTLGVLIVITAVVLITKKPKINNEPSETVVFVDPKFGSLPVLEYGDDISSRIFQIDIDGEKIVISADKLVPEIDTMNVGKTDHILKLENDEEVKISVEVKDTQYPEIIGEDSYEYEIPASVDYYDEDIGLEDFLRDNMKAKDPIDGELELAFEVPEIFGPEDYDVLVSAEDVNGNKTTKVVLVTLTLGEEKETEPTEPEEAETEPTEPEEAETEPTDWNPSDETTTVSTTTTSTTTPSPTTTEPPPYQPTVTPESTITKTTLPPTDGNIGTNPVADPAFPVPPGVPSGAVLTETEVWSMSQVFSYNVVLPNGGTIYEIIISDSGWNCTIIGLDSSGKQYMADKYTGQNLEFVGYTYPDLDYEDVDVLRDVATQFQSAYGY